jgi:phage terminase large subunit GpA-like protein
MVRRKIEKSPLFVKMTWWDKLFWKLCFHCGEEFKKEEGWKAGPFVHEGGGSSYIYGCGHCFTNAEYAEDTYKRRGG